MDSSLDIAHIHMKFDMCILEIHMKESVSQNFDLGPSFDFMKSRKLSFKK